MARSSSYPAAPRSTATPRANEVGAYIEKYATQIERIAHSPASFGGTYSVPIHIELTKLRGH